MFSILEVPVDIYPDYDGMRIFVGNPITFSDFRAEERFALASLKSMILENRESRMHENDQECTL